MAVLNAVSIAEIKARGSIKDADVLKLRRAGVLAHVAIAEAVIHRSQGSGAFFGTEPGAGSGNTSERAA